MNKMELLEIKNLNKKYDDKYVLKDINLRGTTIVMATHARDIVDRMKKRVIQIDKGVIIRDDKRGGYNNYV